MHRLPLLLVVLVALVGASSASAHPTSVTVTLTGTPNPVTAGGTVGYLATLKNNGYKDLGRVRLTAPAPAGMSVVSVISKGSCTSSAATAQCDFGDVAGGATVSATVIMTTPSTPGTVSSSVTWSAKGHHHSYGGDGHDKTQTFTASTSISVQAASPNAISKYVLPAGGTVSTESTTSASNPQSTTVTVPATPTGAATSVSEVNASGPTDACGPTVTCFGQISVVTVAAPPFSATAPLHLAFGLDSSEIPPYTNPATIPLFHDGVAVPNCTGYAGVASPDPCVSARVVKKPPHCDKGQFTVEIDVLSSTNGRWRA
ncbi:MAG: hypothetical protein ABJB93_07105 [Gaiellales bacterium]